MSELIALGAGSTDCPEFVNRVRLALNGVVQESRPGEIYVIQLDNWFGERWFHFAGKIAGAVGVHSKQLVIPPFHPNRVLAQHTYARGETDAWAAVESTPLHFEQASSDNIDRFARKLTKNGVLCWYSGNTKAQTRGAMMVYVVFSEEQFGWYVELQGPQKWKMSKCVGISSNEFERYESGGATKAGEHDE